jgi:hypothetical protein
VVDVLEMPGVVEILERLEVVESFRIPAVCFCSDE